jgi:hypothetical protein
MEQDLSLQGVFNSILAGSQVKLAFLSKKDYESFRTMLLRKYKKYVELLKELEGNLYEGRYVSCSWDGLTKQGTFQLSNTSDKIARRYVAVQL